MVKVLFDTNILIDHFNDIDEATAELARYDDAAITTITWSELMAGAEPHQLDGMRALMCQFIILDLDVQIAELAATLRRDMREARKLDSSKRKALPTPDAVILTTAQRTGRTLITRNTKDFSGMGVYIPYTINDGMVFVNPAKLV
jgi:predicted nucleic acid-binding protein